MVKLVDTLRALVRPAQSLDRVRVRISLFPLMVSYTYKVNNSSFPEKYSDWQSKTVIIPRY